MASPIKQRKRATTTAIALGLTAVILVFTGYMFFTGSYGVDLLVEDPQGAGDGVPLDAAATAVQDIADSIGGL